MLAQGDQTIQMYSVNPEDGNQHHEMTTANYPGGAHIYPTDAEISKCAGCMGEVIVV